MLGTPAVDPQPSQPQQQLVDDQPGQAPAQDREGNHSPSGSASPSPAAAQRLPDDPDITDCIKVSSRSKIAGVAGKIAHSVRDGKRPTILAAGNASITTAVKAIAAARQFLVNDALDVGYVPHFRDNDHSRALLSLHIIPADGVLQRQEQGAQQPPPPQQQQQGQPPLPPLPPQPQPQQQPQRQPQVPVAEGAVPAPHGSPADGSTGADDAAAALMQGLTLHMSPLVHGALSPSSAQQQQQQGGSPTASTSPVQPPPPLSRPAVALEPVELKVSAGSRHARVAGAVAARVREHRAVHLTAVSVDAIANAVMATTHACCYLEREHLQLLVLPQQVRVSKYSRELAAIKLTVVLQ